MSIWDKPQAAEQTTDTTITVPLSGASRVAAHGGRARLLGTQAGPLLTDAGRGIVNGVPYGETEQARKEAVNAMYPFRPGWVARLGAATRSAIGR